MAVIETLYKSSGLVFPLVGVVVALLLSVFIDPYLAFVATSWVIFGLLGLSLDIVWGRAGLLSLGQTAFYGLGGYFGSVVALNFAPMTGNTLIWALPAGALFGALAAALLGYVIFYARMGALQTTILTYTLTLLLWTVSQSFKLTVGKAVIGGDNGMTNIPGFVLGFGAKAAALGPNTVFATVVMVSAVVYFFSRWLMRGFFGRIVDCIRIDAGKTELLGYDIRKYQLLSFAYSGVVAGIAGAMFGLWANYLNPSIFSVQEALLVPMYVLIGGLGTLSGAFIGALAIGGLSFWLGGGVVGGQTTLILGGVLIILVLFLQNGILGAFDLLWRKFIPDANAAAKNNGAVKIDTAVLEQILKQVAHKSGVKISLSTDQVFKQFGGVIPVNKVTRFFEPGIPYSLIGPNGAGKSSFLKICMGLYLPESGKVKLGDLDITKMPIFDRVRHGMGVKNQKPQVFGELSVFDNLWTAAYSRTKSDKQALLISNQILDMLGLQKQAAVQAGILSHGQQQWLDIGMVLCLAPDVILLDEPAAGMTKQETRELSLLIRTLAKYTTVIVVEHDMEFVTTLAGHVTVLHQGEVFAEGNIEDLRQDDRVLDIYLGRRAHV
ncbi:MAG: ATP-binding cassette domain-containing protein [OCS116 cluster bacterium]|nr:ATP-binding cassette domain-containing protein [OCS116 cluster bacterium]